MITLEPATTELDLKDVCNVLSTDRDGLNWLAYYADGKAWVNELTRTRKALVAYVDGSTAGFIDLEFDGDQRQVVISYYITPEFRGKGHAKELLSSSLSWLKTNTSARVVFAYANSENTKSIKVLDRANFRYETKRKDMLCFVTVLH